MPKFTNNRCSTAIRWISGVALAASTLGAGIANAAPNTRAQDPIFNEPAQGGLKQIGLFVGDVLIAYILWPESTGRALDVSPEEKAYQSAIDIPTSESERSSKLAELQKESSNERIAERIQRLQSASIMTDERKVQAVKDGYANLMQANAEATRTTADMGKVLCRRSDASPDMLVWRLSPSTQGPARTFGSLTTPIRLGRRSSPFCNIRWDRIAVEIPRTPTRRSVCCFAAGNSAGSCGVSRRTLLPVPV